MFGTTLAVSLSACAAPISDRTTSLSSAAASEQSQSNAGPDVTAPSSVQANEDGIRRFIPGDATVRMEKHGDLDGDGQADVLLVLQQNAQAASAPRRLMLLRGAADGSFVRIVDNPSAILCITCGGAMGDPLADIAIEPNGFAIVFEGGSRELWSRRFAFAYSKQDDDWRLESIDQKVSDRINGHQEEEQTPRPQKIREVSIRNFDATQMMQNSNI